MIPFSHLPQKFGYQLDGFCSMVETFCSKQLLCVKQLHLLQSAKWLLSRQSVLWLIENKNLFLNEGYFRISLFQLIATLIELNNGHDNHWFSSVVHHIPGIHQVQKNKYFPSAQFPIQDLHFTSLPTKATQIRLASLMMQSPLPLRRRQAHPLLQAVWRRSVVLWFSVSYSNMYHAAFQNSFLLGMYRILRRLKIPVRYFPIVCSGNQEQIETYTIHEEASR